MLKFICKQQLIVVEDINSKSVVATGTLIVEPKFIHQGDKVRGDDAYGARAYGVVHAHCTQDWCLCMFLFTDRR